MPFATNAGDGVRIYYEVEGSGPPFLLHVGFMGRIQDWRQAGIVDGLRDEYQLILIDPRGQGQSDKPHDVESYGIERFVDDVVAVLDSLNIVRAHYLGYSMGGQVGYAAGVFASDRLLSLVLGGSHPYFERPETVLMPTVQEEADLLRQGMSVALNRFEESYGPAPVEMREQWLQNDGEAMAANTLAQESFPDISQQLASVTLPTLIYCGTEDDTFAKARRASESIPGATFISLEGLRHLQAFRQGENILPHIRSFLAEVTTPA